MAEARALGDRRGDRASSSANRPSVGGQEVRRPTDLALSARVQITRRRGSVRYGPASRRRRSAAITAASGCVPGIAPPGNPNPIIGTPGKACASAEPGASVTGTFGLTTCRSISARGAPLKNFARRCGTPSTRLSLNATPLRLPATHRLPFLSRERASAPDRGCVPRSPPRGVHTLLEWMRCLSVLRKRRTETP